MKLRKQLLVLPLSISFLMGCNSSKGKAIYLSFYQDEGNQLDTMEVFVGKTTENDVQDFIDGIVINERTGYDVTWPDFDLSSIKTDTEFSALYNLHDYVISFVYQDEVVATTTYNIKTKFVDVPFMPASEEGYIYKADEFDFRNRNEDFSVNVTKIERPYMVTFMRNEDDIDPVIVTYTITDPIITVPQGEEGYDTTWICGDLVFAAGEEVDMTGKVNDYTFMRNAVAKTFTITYVSNSETISTQTVTFGQEYELIPVVTSSDIYEGIAWVNEQGKEFPQEGIWDYGDDVTLSAQWGLSFEGTELPSILNEGENTTYEIFNRNSTSGNKCLKATAKEDGKLAINLSNQFFTDMFANENVKEIVFDATSNKDYNTFAARYKGDTGTALGVRVGNFTYERSSVAGCGVVSEGWKTFRFKRDYLNSLENFIIIPAVKAGDFVLIDNVHPVTEELESRVFGFETGCYAGPDGSAPVPNLLFKDGGHASTSAQHVIFNVRDESNYEYLGYDYDIKTEGQRSLHFTKGKGSANYSALYVHVYIHDLIGPGGYFTFDMYTSMALNSFSVANGLSGSQGHFWSDSEQHPKETWRTYTCKYEEMSADGRFMQISGSTWGDYYIDNIVIHKANEA